MILEEYLSCELGVMLFVVGIVIVSDLLLIWMGLIIYRFRESVDKEQLRVLVILFSIIVIVFNIYGISEAIMLPSFRCQ